MKNFFQRFLLVFLLVGWLTVSTGISQADVKLPAIFSSNMVLQQKVSAPVWGWADSGEKITVSINGQTKTTTADKDGNWKIGLDPLKAGGPFKLSVKGNNSLELENVLVGEVWVCSGQSNMGWTLRATNNGEEAIKNSKNPKIRLITVPRKSMEEPQKDFEGSWVEASPETTPNFTAVGYYFGRELNSELNIPIGLINTSYGGTPSEAWTKRGAMDAKSNLKPLLDHWDELAAKFDPEKAAAVYEKQLEKWKVAVKKAKEEKKRLPRRPRLNNPRVSQHRPAGLYNAMIAPLVPYAIKGAIWYQGESNSSRAHQYRTIFPNMIENWRADWKQGDFPFYFVQLANFRAIEKDPGDSTWAELREAQSMTLTLPNTGEAVIIDIGEANDIHPKNKTDVGKRLSLWALAKDYGKDIVYSGPRYKSSSKQDGKIVIEFDHAGGGLVAKGGEALKGFAIAGEDKKFVWADAKINGSTITVSSKGVSNPVAVRYAWADNPICNLYNKEGIPASPFRTDKWKGITEGVHHR